MTTLAELVAETPAASRGVVTQLSAGTGTWRWVVELADPSAGTAVVWYDVTAMVAGVEVTRGSDQYAGRYRAMVVELELEVDDDSLAPWNDDTSATFGTHVELGAGLLVRGGLIRVAADTVQEWLPRFTARVEAWRDATRALGQIRQHRVTARDLLVELHGVPVANDLQCNWSDRVTHVLTEASWAFGSTVYGALQQTGPVDVLTLPDRDEQPSASLELDATLDPAGAVWYTDRTGKLIVRPQPGDTFHAGMFTAGATGTPWTDPTLVTFAWNAEDGGGVAYELDDEAATSFGIDSTELAVVNRVKVTDPGGVYDTDDPVSVQRYGPRPMAVTWQVENDTVADDVLNRLAYATREATPLTTTADQPGVFPAAARLDWLHPVRVVHRTSLDRSIVTADGIVRQIVERFAPRSDTSIEWELVVIVDVDAVDVDTDLLPVENLAASGVTDSEVLLSWTNPGGQPVAPTETWVRVPAETSIWLELDYPITSLAWLGLDPDRGYTFDVRLVRRVDGLVTHTSPIRSVSFTTLEAPGAVIDDDGGVTMPDVGVCVVNWRLEKSSDGTIWATVETGTAASGALVELDPATFVDGYSYRIVTQEDCGGVLGDEYTSDPFVPVCATPPEYPGTDPYSRSDLTAFVPEICTPDRVLEAVSGNYGTHGPAWGGPLSIDVDELALASSTGAGGIIAYGVTSNLIDTGDVTIGCTVSVQTAETVTLWSVPGIRLDAVAGVSGWYPRVTATLDGGEQVSVVDPTLRSLITPLELVATYDQETGVLTLYVDGSSVGTDAASLPGTARSSSQGGAWYVGAPAASWITLCGAWSSVVAPTLPAAAWSGGTELTPGDGYKYHVFTTSGTLTKVSGGATTMDYLVVGGGGGGGGNTGGGGGAGQVSTGSILVSSTTTITVGAGGAGGNNPVSPSNTNGLRGAVGGSSSLGSLVTAVGGGGGGAGSSDSSQRAGGDGASGGGGANASAGGSATAGYAGGSQTGWVSPYQCGGGGGAGGAGENGSTSGTGDGGPGVYNAIGYAAGEGYPTGYFGGGGGGGRFSGTPAAAGGIGGGGGGSYGGGLQNNQVNGFDGIANTGGGAGGGGGNTASGAHDGGSGIVIVRYAL